jgi:small GTP-binding protein
MADIKKRKVVLVGEGSVGKTALIRKFVTGQFDDKYITTIGTANSKKSLHFPSGDIDLTIWDLMGQHITPVLLQNYLRGAQGAIMVGDLTRPETFDKWSDYWGPEVRKVAAGIPIVTCGNKADLTDKFVPLNEYANKLEEQGYTVMGMYLTSAKTGKNVENAFQTLGKAFAEV